jgi:hypothetical protein
MNLLPSRRGCLSCRAGQRRRHENQAYPAKAGLLGLTRQRVGTSLPPVCTGSSRAVIERVEGIHVGGEEDFVGPGKAAEFDPLQLIIDISGLGIVGALRRTAPATVAMFRVGLGG